MVMLVYQRINLSPMECHMEKTVKEVVYKIPAGPKQENKLKITISSDI